MTKGRTVQMTGEPLVLSTGVTVYPRKVSPYTLNAARQAVPRPAPPRVVVNLGDGKTAQETNEADPDYKAQLAQWNEDVNLRVTDVMLRLGIQVEIDTDTLAERRAEFAALGLAGDDHDHLFYIKHVAIGSEDDLNALAAAITGKSQPTPQAVAAHADTFRGDVQGEAAA